MATSQNGWPVLASDSPRLHRWVIPARNGERTITLRGGSAGFILCHFLLWFAETIEPLVGGILDDWGYAYRPIRGQSSGFSNHASGTAADANATKHPLGATGTFTDVQVQAIGKRLDRYNGTLRHGLFYRGRPDPMHVELDKPLTDAERVARRLMKTPRGKRLLLANPGQDKVILS